MSSPILQLLVLAGIVIFLILRLRSVLGTRDGFEPTQKTPKASSARRKPDLSVIEGGPDRDIIDHVPDGSSAAKALAKMKAAEPEFGVADFLQGARGAYEMILMGFERGDLAEIKPFLADDVYQSFAEVVESREAQGLTIEAEFVGVRELSLSDAEFHDETRLAEITVRFVGELTSVVRDRAGEIIEGSATQIKRQKDVWTFARAMGADDPNWQLVATGE
ncbi:Tim44/TimA family putative adaptor protein [Primorskyibacter flagellatus]|uniref:Predicted lipid-binding transport protein, Tim44 family n=1 Tax=Primorskyibacter flagellatus TaxID=1387277 RepID=A0A1W2A851_9RHOB|nr:Tim44/TimA family putative adaptor protein [Primorskyibacter flagellatus]SMC56448.1 Predicted lipid-binding transport protein, Tim44 family [Primorskyibacter flagellatus]